jgi:hypothetical protein
MSLIHSFYLDPSLDRPVHSSCQVPEALLFVDAHSQLSTLLLSVPDNVPFDCTARTRGFELSTKDGDETSDELFELRYARLEGDVLGLERTAKGKGSG